MKTMGLELPGMGAAGGGGGGVGGVGGEGGGRKREVLMRDARYGVGSILVEEGAGPTSVFLIVEGECRIIKGKPRTQSAGENRCTNRSASILRVFPVPPPQGTTPGAANWEHAKSQLRYFYAPNRAEDFVRRTDELLFYLMA